MSPIYVFCIWPAFWAKTRYYSRAALIILDASDSVAKFDDLRRQAQVLARLGNRIREFLTQAAASSMIRAALYTLTTV
ncbi:MAG: hypothetical protein OQL06_11155 [Gammaproteobacteria bacterium]|nr:hypothetical protein [Gammaproteobacteria bacterium]